MPLLLSVILIWGFRRFQQNKHLSELEKKDALLREQKLLIEKHLAVENERSRIASEMHDDLGSGLTTIKYLSDRAIQNAKSDTDKQQIEKIATQSNELIRSMSEIIWSMNTRFDNVEMFCFYLRRYASEYFDDYQIQLHWNQNLDNPRLEISGERRRALLLIVKECLHNVIKHAQATIVNISIHTDANHCSLEISDNGIGFELDKIREHGNGLHNMQKKLSELNGNVKIQSGPSGSTFYIMIPLQANQL